MSFLGETWVRRGTDFALVSTWGWVGVFTSAAYARMCRRRRQLAWVAAVLAAVSGGLVWLLKHGGPPLLLAPITPFGVSTIGALLWCAQFGETMWWHPDSLSIEFWELEACVHAETGVEVNAAETLRRIPVDVAARCLLALALVSDDDDDDAVTSRRAAARFVEAHRQLVGGLGRRR